jgi:hypothetical protein
MAKEPLTDEDRGLENFRDTLMDVIQDSHMNKRWEVLSTSIPNVFCVRDWDDGRQIQITVEWN